MNDLDREHVHTMKQQTAKHLAAALNNLYGAQRAICELTNPGPCHDRDWAESGEGAAGIALLAQTIDLTWALRAIAETIEGRNIV